MERDHVAAQATTNSKHNWNAILPNYVYIRRYVVYVLCEADYTGVWVQNIRV